MNFTFDLLILKKDICRVGLKEQLITWGDEMFSQQPPRYINDSDLLFEWSNDLAYYKDYLDKFIPHKIAINEFEAFRLVGNNMYELERLINYKQESMQNLLSNEIIAFVEKLSKLETFLVFLIRDEEYIDDKYELNDASELVNIFYDCISYSTSKGVIIIK